MNLLTDLKTIRNNIIAKYSGANWLGHDCDGCLWNAIAYISGMKSIKLNLAQYQPGKWQRRPPPQCYPNFSKSETSNDMLTGVLFWLLESEDLNAAKNLWKYGSGNLWVMGKGPLSRTWLRPNGIYLLDQIIRNLGGDGKWWAKLIPNLYFPVRKDYERHLMTISILLTYRLTGGISNQMRKRLKENAVNDFRDPLFTAVYGIFDRDYLLSAMSMISRDDYHIPSYVRGHPAYKDIYRLFVIWIILEYVRFRDPIYI